MTTNVDTTPEPEVNSAPDETVNETQEETTNETKVGELHEDGSQQNENQPEQKKVDSVPIARLNKEIERRKELEAKLDEAKANQPTADGQESPEVKELADKLAKIEEREVSEKREKVFAENLAKTLEDAPEFKGVVNEEVIKQMAFNPSNKDKTYLQLVEEAYGNAVPGRSSIDSTTPRGGAKAEKVDLTRAQRDTAYRKEVLSNPELKKQYNEGLENRIPW